MQANILIVCGLGDIMCNLFLILRRCIMLGCLYYVLLFSIFGHRFELGFNHPKHRFAISSMSTILVVNQFFEFLIGKGHGGNGNGFNE